MPFSLTFRAFLLFLFSGEGSGWPSHVLSRGLSNGLNLYMDLIHSFIQTISVAPLQVHFYSEALPTQHGYCVGVSRRSGLAQSPYIGARAIFEPKTLPS